MFLNNIGQFLILYILKNTIIKELPLPYFYRLNVHIYF
jgi:hypothetical protein